MEIRDNLETLVTKVFKDQLAQLDHQVDLEHRVHLVGKESEAPKELLVIKEMLEQLVSRVILEKREHREKSVTQEHLEL